MVTIDFSDRDTIIDKGVGPSSLIDFTATGAKTTLFTGPFNGTIEDVCVAASAISASSGMTNPATVGAKVYTNIGGTETSKIYPLLIWNDSETSARKSQPLVIPINKRYTSGATVVISVEFVEANTNTVTSFAGSASLGYTIAP